MSTGMGMTEIALLGSSCLCFVLVIGGIIGGIVFAMKKRGEQG